MDRAKTLWVVVLSLLFATLWVSAPAEAHNCYEFSVVGGF